MANIPILDELRTQLKREGPARWPEISERTGCAVSFLRKLAYGDRPNPGLRRIEALRTYFAETANQTHECLPR